MFTTTIVRSIDLRENIKIKSSRKNENGIIKEGGSEKLFCHHLQMMKNMKGGSQSNLSLHTT